MCDFYFHDTVFLFDSIFAPLHLGQTASLNAFIFRGVTAKDADDVSFQRPRQRTYIFQSRAEPAERGM